MSNKVDKLLEKVNCVYFEDNKSCENPFERYQNKKIALLFKNFVSKEIKHFNDENHEYKVIRKIISNGEISLYVHDDKSTSTKCVNVMICYPTMYNDKKLERDTRIIYIRRTKDYNDYTGERNMPCSLETIGSSIVNLLNEGRK